MDFSPVNKAIAGAVTAAVVALLVKYGVVLDPNTSSAVGTIVYALVAALVGFLGVYIAPRNKPTV